MIEGLGLFAVQAGVAVLLGLWIDTKWVAWSTRRIAALSSLPLPLLVAIPATLLLFSLSTATRERCGIDACGMGAVAALALLAYALVAFAVGAVDCALVRRFVRS